MSQVLCAKVTSGSTSMPESFQDGGSGPLLSFPENITLPSVG